MDLKNTTTLFSSADLASTTHYYPDMHTSVKSQFKIAKLRIMEKNDPKFIASNSVFNVILTFSSGESLAGVMFENDINKMIKDWNGLSSKTGQLFLPFDPGTLW
jgi:hypothetical protein